MADDMRKVGIQFVSEGAEQSTKNVESFDQANQDLTKTLDTLVQKQSEVGTTLEQVDKQIASIGSTMSEMLSREIDLGFDDDLFESLQTQHDALVEKSEKLAQQWTNVSARINLAKGELEELNQVSAKTAEVGPSGAGVAEETQKAAQNVSQLTEAMMVAAKVASEFGMSGSEASRQISMAAKDAGVSFTEMGRSILQELKQPVTETNSELLKLLQSEEAASEAGKTLFADMMRTPEPEWRQFNQVLEEIEKNGLEIGTAFSQLPGKITEANSQLMELLRNQEATGTPIFGSASETGFAEMMQLMGDDTWERWVNQISKVPPIMQEVATTTTQATQAQAQNVQVIEEQIATISILDQQVGELGNNWRKAFMSFRDIGVKPQEALQALHEEIAAFGAEADPLRVLNRNLDERFRIEQRLVAQGKTWNEIQREMAALADRNATATSRVGAAGIQSSRAFFALTLASFGVMSVAQELKKSFGDDLPPAFEKASAAIQQIASFGSAGAFVGGVPGAIFGGIAGGLIALTTAAITLDPELQRLNQSLDNMSNRDEVVETLSEVAGVSKDIVEVWVEAARKDPTFAALLEDIVKKGEPVPGLLATINEGSRLLTGNIDSLGTTFGELGERANQALLLIFAGLTGVGEAIKIVLEGGGTSVEENWGRINDRIWESLTRVTEAVQGLGISEKQAEDLTRGANAVLEDQEKILNKLTAAAERYADALSNAGYRTAQNLDNTNDQLAQAFQQFTNTVADAAEQRANSVIQADQNLANQSSDLWQNYQNTVVDANQQLSDKVFDIHTNLANKIADVQLNLGNSILDIQAGLAHRLQDIQTELSESIFDINQDLQNKLADLAHQRDRDIQKANDATKDAAKDLARELFEIERERLQSIEALAFSTHEQLQDARTSHDRDRILRRAQFEQAQIDQQANNARQDAFADFADKVAQAEEERRLAQSNFDYEVRLAKMLADQKIEQANRAAAIQMAQAERNAALQIEQAQRQAEQQIAIARRESAEQLAIAERENAQKLEQAQRRYAQELADAQRTYAQQVASAARAEEQRNNDALRALQQRSQAIHDAAEEERNEIRRTLELALFAYRAIIESINLAKAGLLGFAQQYQNFIDDPLGLDPNNGNVPLIPLPYLPDTITPATERFGLGTVNPVSTSMNTRNNSINIVINDATDPIRVATQVRRVLQDTLSGAA